MNIFTEGSELITAVTNIFIMLSALYAYFRIKRKKVNNYWKKFFFCLAFDGLMGFIIHGFIFNKLIIDILWLILLVGFSFTINYLLFIFLEKLFKINNKYLVLLTVGLYGLLIIEVILKIEFLYTFIIYAGICLLVVTLIIIREYRHNLYYLLAVFFQIIGGVFLLNNNLYIHIIFDFDKNGIYHIFMILTCLLFYFGCIKEIN